MRHCRQTPGDAQEATDQFVAASPPPCTATRWARRVPIVTIMMIPALLTLSGCGIAGNGGYEDAVAEYRACRAHHPDDIHACDGSRNHTSRRPLTPQ
jgi:hypothetical protein